MVVVKYFKQLPCSGRQFHSSEGKIKKVVGDGLKKLSMENCFYVDVDDEEFELEDESKLLWVLETPFSLKKITRKSRLKIEEATKSFLIEIGPRLNYSTPFSTNAVNICKAAGIKTVTRIEFSTRYLLEMGASFTLDDEMEKKIVSVLHDRMTECRYDNPVESFQVEKKPDEIYEVDVMKDGREALEKANIEMGLAFDSWDLDYYTKLFRETIKRNPTNVECFDLAQSNRNTVLVGRSPERMCSIPEFVTFDPILSEHSRHWFFRGRLVVDGEECPESLFKMIMSTQEHTNNNNVIKFSDNSSAIKGFDVTVLQPSNPTEPSKMTEKDCGRHVIFTAETHNFPTGVAPFPGATTGTGGRIRDVHATGRGAHVVAGTAGYSFGSLNIPGYKLPWEDSSLKYPSNFASPLEIAVEASNGASDYGNKFGEPVLTGFARSFGLTLPGGDRREYIKPIMFSGGMGQLEAGHVTKATPTTDMEVVKIGGPVYRIGVGGGAASSVQVQGDNKEELDFGAVQRGDAEMEQKLNRLIRACIERGNNNPIASIHDQGAGGNGNVLKEIAEPAGAVIKSSQFQLGDPTINLLELWGAEYQESNAILVRRADKEILTKIGERERCPVSFVGKISGDGRIKLENFTIAEGDGSPAKKRSKKSFQYPVDLQLEHVLGSMPRKEFQMVRQKPTLEPLSLPEGLTVMDALERVLRLPSVASKRYLTNKVDRCVTGLVAQQQCVGPLHTPLADVAVTALSYFNKEGSATAIGEQPIKGLIDPGCMARMSVGEALTNLVFARITDLKDVKCSGNWMWPAKLPGEGAALLDACSAMCDVMKKLGIAVDGGKDSLSMAARVGDETVKAPGTLVISVYAGCPDIRATVTPDLKCPEGQGCLLHVDLGQGRSRLGGSALAHCYGQIGNQSPDLDHPETFVNAFNVTQRLIKDRKISAGHDISDGGLVTCLLEMAFAGNCAIDIDMCSESGVPSIDKLFAEELGLVLEVSQNIVQDVLDAYSAANVPCSLIGHSTKEVKEISIMVNKKEILKEKMTALRDVWEETSFQLERYQTDEGCVQQEMDGLKARLEPPYHVPFEAEIINFVSRGRPENTPPIKVAVLREEGSNSDQEMAAVLHMAGFEVWDVNMQDMCSGKITLEQFQGVVFVGGFSYADVCGSAKGWAATILYNQSIREQFLKFRERTNTFSLGVCNGCQLMGLLGWVAQDEEQKENTDSGVGQGVFLDHNDSGRFECRFVTVKVQSSPAIMLRGMEDTVFGVWSAHGEGKMVFKTPDIQNDVLRLNLAPVRYVDDFGQTTTSYPFNPNGSPEGIAALCSEDGRHLAIMPHPERCFLPWQCPWMPYGMKEKLDVSPWYKMFQNAFDWCVEQVRV